MEMALIQGVFKILLALSGIVLGRLTLMWMDENGSTESTFGAWLSQADDTAKAIYYAGRLVFAGLIVGAALS